MTTGENYTAPDHWNTLGIEEPPPDFTPTLLSVAEEVLQEFDISYTGNGGGTLKRVDLKRVDAISCIKSSLLENFASDGALLEEIIVNANGDVEFIQIGSSQSPINPYYTITSTQTAPTNFHVMVTGGTPKLVRHISDWKDLVGDPEQVPGCYRFDATNLSSDCISPDFKTTVVFTFKDPHLDNINSKSWQNGIEDFFEVSSPFESILGFLWDINPGSNVPDTADIFMQNQTSIPLLITPSDGAYTIGEGENFPDLKVLQRRGIVSPTLDVPIECWQTEGDIITCNSDDAVKIDLTPFEFITKDDDNDFTLNKFMGVSNIYIVGLPLTSCYGKPLPGEQTNEPTEDNTELYISSAPYLGAKKLYRLTEGIDYVICYDEEDADSNPHIKFANNSRDGDPIKFETGMPFKIDPNDKALNVTFNGASTGTGSVLPMNTEGILVEQVWAQIDVNTPCFIVKDPKGKANEIADNLTVKLAAISIIKNPPPIAYNGDIIDQTELQTDNDPTTKQDFEETEMERILNSMFSGMSLTLSLGSLDEQQTIDLSKNLYDVLVEDNSNGSSVIYTHVCPPTDEPELGQTGPKGGIINSIEYSYSDQGSYLINVTEGPKYVGDLAGLSGGIYSKKTQDIQMEGIIIYDYGNHINYKVKADGIGIVEAINTQAKILTTRDRVSITIHNNEVEE